MQGDTLGEETRDLGEAREREVTREDVATSRELVEFIRRSPSMFHSVATIRDYLDRAGATYLPEGKAWRLERGGTYYTVRNGSSLIAWRVGADLDRYHFQMCASHTDSPTYKVKSVPERPE